ncbi:MAG: hypothetical protein JW910_06930 [Anaerolineae bacterium]|nr:hypothetical protein [Anaerolineae bacterium]
MSFLKKLAGGGKTNVQALRAKGDITGLVALLEHKESAICRQAADALDQLGWKPTSDQAGITYWIVRGDWDALAAVGAPAVPPLLAVANSQPESQPSVIDPPLACVVSMGAAAVEPLIRALGDSDQNMVARAEEALLGLGQAALGPMVEGLRQAPTEKLSTAIANFGETAIPALITALRRSTGDERREVMLTLKLISVTHLMQVARTLAPLFGSSDPEVIDAAGKLYVDMLWGRWHSYPPGTGAGVVVEVFLHELMETHARLRDLLLNGIKAMHMPESNPYDSIGLLAEQKSVRDELVRQLESWM